MQVKKQQLEPDLEQQTGSNWERSTAKAVYCHSVYLNAEYFMRNARLDEAQAGSGLPGEVCIHTYVRTYIYIYIYIHI